MLVNQRVVLNGSRGTVKYYGPVDDTEGVWVGIDWDIDDRGKHDGTHGGRQYFKASGALSGSFVREQNLEFGTDILAEILAKYDNDICFGENESDKVSSGSGRWELVKMDKIHRMQKEIFRLKCIVLSLSNVSHLKPEHLDNINFKFCTELDLTKTLVRKWTQIADILRVFPALWILNLGDNRIEPIEECSSDELDKFSTNSGFAQITHLSMNRCRLTENTANQLQKLFTNVEELYLAKNGLTSYQPAENCNKLRLLDFQDNPIKNIDSIRALFTLPSLEYLNLSSCQICDFDFGSSSFEGFPQLKTLVLQNNPISQWKSIDELARLPSLKKLVLIGTLLPGSRGVDSREMIIAKIPQIVDLDRCDICPFSRSSAELLFLSRFAASPISMEHKGTIERLASIYKMQIDPNCEKTHCEDEARKKELTSGIRSRRIFLAYGDQSTERMLSLALTIHKVVGLGARLFGFDPEKMQGIRLARSDPNYPSEFFPRTKDNLLRQFDLCDGDTIAFI